MKYEVFKYIYPPRPKNAVSPTDIDLFDNNSMIAQCKLNGSNCTIYTNGHDFLAYNRHGLHLSNFQIEKEEILKLYKNFNKGSWLVLNGEYMNKSKSDENKQIFNHKLVIFDLLVIDNNYLIGKTFQDRVEIMDKIYGQIDSEKEYLYKITENIYRVKSYNKGFKELYEKLSKIDMFEGLVCKRKSGRLEVGITENNNIRSQVKFRKKTKNYKY
jgi:hypothetical protein